MAIAVTIHGVRVRCRVGRIACPHVGVERGRPERGPATRPAMYVVSQYSH